MVEIDAAFQPPIVELKQKIEDDDVQHLLWCRMLHKCIEDGGADVQKQVCRNEPISADEEQVYKSVDGEREVGIAKAEDDVGQTGEEPNLKGECR